MGGDVFKVRVRFPAGKWQSVSRWGLVFGFQFRFGLLRRGTGWRVGVSGNTFAFVCCFEVGCMLCVIMCKGVISFLKNNGLNGLYFEYFGFRSKLNRFIAYLS